MKVLLWVLWQLVICLACIQARAPKSAKVSHELGSDDLAVFVAEQPAHMPLNEDSMPKRSCYRGYCNSPAFEKRNDYPRAEAYRSLPHDSAARDYAMYPALFKRINRNKELKNLYGRIAEKFPSLAKQGLKGDGLDDLFGMLATFEAEQPAHMPLNEDRMPKRLGYRGYSPVFEKRIDSLRAEAYRGLPYDSAAGDYAMYPALFKRINRDNELKNLYGRITEKFPFLAKQGLKGDGLRDLFGMTIFGQPRSGN